MTRPATFMPPTVDFDSDFLATGTMPPPESSRATTLYTSAAVGTPEPVTSRVPTP